MYRQTPAARPLAAYDPYLDDDQRQTIRERGAELADVRVAHVNSTASGGGVAELLQSLLPLLDDVGVDTDWLVMDAEPDFFDVTKAIHNGMQGDRSELTAEMRETYRRVTVDNAEALDEAYDVIVLHDPQTLGMTDTLAERFPDTTLVWRCHIDLTDAADAYLDFLRPFLKPVDHVVFSRPEYGSGETTIPESIIYPAIDPLTEKNCALPDLPADARDAADMSSYPFDPDRPLVVQVSRFDPWKDPLGVIDAYHAVIDSVPEAQLALVGSMPDDDPEGVEVFERVEDAAGDPDIHLLTNLPDAGINAIQRAADVMVQKSLREGFALTVSEALWKRTPVVGANVGGIPLQVEDGENGYLVDPRDIEGTAERITRLLEDDALNRRFGERGRDVVRERFLLPRLLVDYLNVLAETA